MALIIGGREGEWRCTSEASVGYLRRLGRRSFEEYGHRGSKPFSSRPTNSDTDKERGTKGKGLERRKGGDSERGAEGNPALRAAAGFAQAVGSVRVCACKSVDDRNGQYTPSTHGVWIDGVPPPVEPPAVAAICNDTVPPALIGTQAHFETFMDPSGAAAPRKSWPVPVRKTSRIHGPTVRRDARGLRASDVRRTMRGGMPPLRSGG